MGPTQTTFPQKWAKMSSPSSRWIIHLFAQEIFKTSKTTTLSIIESNRCNDASQHNKMSSQLILTILSWVVRQLPKGECLFLQEDALTIKIMMQNSKSKSKDKPLPIVENVPPTLLAMDFQSKESHLQDLLNWPKTLVPFIKKNGKTSLLFSTL